MSDYLTTARPYARAVFDDAVKHNALDAWSKMLNALAELSLIEGFDVLIGLPELSASQTAQIIIDLLAEHLDDKGQNLVRILAENGRLPCLSSVQCCFETYRHDYEKALDVTVTSFEPLSPAQAESLTASLKQRLKKEIELSVNVDKSILGGAVINAGDLVIDGSVRGKLKRLEVELHD